MDYSFIIPMVLPSIEMIAIGNLLLHDGTDQGFFCVPIRPRLSKLRECNALAGNYGPLL